MRRLALLSLAGFAWLGLPNAAFACMTCGNHGDTAATLYVFGAFMTVPWMLAAGVAWFVRKQLRGLDQGAGANLSA